MRGLCVECVSDADCDKVVGLTQAYLARGPTTVALQQQLAQDLWRLLKPYNTFTMSLLLKVLALAM